MRPRPACIATLFALALLLTACASGSTSSVTATVTPSATAIPPTVTPTRGPATYTTRTVAKGFGSPDDLTLDAQGRIIFADFGNNGVNRIEANGAITPLARGFPEPEGIIALPDGTLLIAVQGKDGEHLDRLERLPPGGSATTIATFANPTNNPGMDSISLDPRTGDILVADSPNGIVYRVTPDGQTRTVIARGFVRPTDAITDNQGNIYIADEYGNAVVRLAPDGTQTKLITTPDPDDLAFDIDGTLLVTVLGDNTVIRLDPATGQKLQTLATDLFEPQGLVVDAQGDIYVSEQRANKIIELVRG